MGHKSQYFTIAIKNNKINVKNNILKIFENCGPSKHEMNHIPENEGTAFDIDCLFSSRSNGVQAKAKDYVGVKRNYWKGVDETSFGVYTRLRILHFPTSRSHNGQGIGQNTQKFHLSGTNLALEQKCL